MAATLDVMFPGDSELASLMRAKDWTAPSLGPVEQWPAKLRAAVGIVLTSRFPMWMGWGEDRDREGRAAVRRRLPATRHAGQRRSRHVGEDRPQPDLERVQVHARRRDPGLARHGDRVRLEGTVYAESAGPGRGSEFTVSLPAHELPSELPSAAIAQRAMHSNAGRVLIVDDNVDAAEMLKELLAIDGHDIEVAHDAPGALEVAETFRPHIAVLDLGLPVVDGFELARLLRDHPSSAAANIIALTGYGQPEDRTKTREAGFVAHLVKPVDVAELRALIGRLLPAPAAR